MFNDITKPPPPLPSPELTEVIPGVHLLRPLSRRGTGPGMIILSSDYHDSLTIEQGVPSPSVKWAEEGYAVIEIQVKALTAGKTDVIKHALEALQGCEQCEPKGQVGLVGQYIPSFAYDTKAIRQSDMYTKHTSLGYGTSWHQLSHITLPS